MTDRINWLVVTLGNDYRDDDDDDVEAIVDAIMMVKGVIAVHKNVSRIEDHVAYVRARSDLQRLLRDVLRDETTTEKGTT